MMRRHVLRAMLAVALAQCVVPASAIAQTAAPAVLVPMNVETFHFMQRIARNGGFGATAYKNYIVGLFEGLLYAEGTSPEGPAGKLFCLPPEYSRDKIIKLFEWMETDFNRLVADAPPKALVSELYASYLNKNFPCTR
jgi:hypothetical protein